MIKKKPTLSAHICVQFMLWYELCCCKLCGRLNSVTTVDNVESDLQASRSLGFSSSMIQASKHEGND